MKKNILFILAFICGNFQFITGTVLNDVTGNNASPKGISNPPGVKSSNGLPENNMKGGPVSTLVINQFDSVFFDIAQAVINGSSVEFPVYFRSDDVINSLDFAFKYNQTHLEYDTIINLTSYIEPLSYYNPNDSTVRLTSYSFTQPYSNDTPLVIVRFTLLSGQLCSNDLDSVSALLNGDACAYLVSDCLSGLFDAPAEVPMNLFPNPASDWVTIRTGSVAFLADSHLLICVFVSTCGIFCNSPVAPTIWSLGTVRATL